MQFVTYKWQKNIQNFTLQAQYDVRTNPEPILSVQGRTNPEPILNHDRMVAEPILLIRSATVWLWFLLICSATVFGYGSHTYVLIRSHFVRQNRSWSKLHFYPPMPSDIISFCISCSLDACSLLWYQCNHTSDHGDNGKNEFAQFLFTKYHRWITSNQTEYGVVLLPIAMTSWHLHVSPVVSWQPLHLMVRLKSGLWRTRIFMLDYAKADHRHSE